jgi:acyl carrier protein
MEAASLDGLEDKIRAFICDELGYEPAEIGPGTLLFSTGLVDSFTFVGTLALIEATLGCELDPRSITVENFDSIGRMTEFLRGHLA